MGVSINYVAKRQSPLSSEEERVIRQRTDISNQEFAKKEIRGELFRIYNQHESSDVIFEGATKLPLTSQEDIWFAVQFWCALLSDIRRALGGQWEVRVEDHDIQWDEAIAAYDPSK